MFESRHQEETRPAAKINAKDRRAELGNERREEDGDGGGEGFHQKTPAGLINPTGDHLLRVASASGGLKHDDHLKL